MQTVQFQCGKCGKLMAVSVEHLGGQVHCPHCLEIVQAPVPSEPVAQENSPVERQETGDSIFSNPDEIPSDDLFGGPAPPLVEMPSEAPTASAPVPLEVPAKETDFSAPRRPATMPPPPPLEEADQEELPPAPVARRPGPSMLVPMLLIFLIPYSIVCTVYIAWTLIFPPRSPFDPLELMRDPKPNDGGPRRIKSDLPLPGKLKTSLKQPLQIGDLEVTPLKVEFSDGNLALHLKMHNLSKDLAFNPIHDSFGKYTESGKAKPYTYLEGEKIKLFGGFFEWRQGPPGKEVPVGLGEARGIIGPGQDVLVILKTFDKYRPEVQQLLESGKRLLWRVQVRRGLVKVGNREVSATAVIGVEFTSQMVDKDKI